MADVLFRSVKSIPLLSRLKTFLYRRAIGKYRSTNISKVSENHFKKIRTVGILFDANDTKGREAVIGYRQQLQESGITVSLFGYFNSKVDGITFPFDFIDIRDLSFAYLPEGDRVRQFISTPFDVLINLDTQMHKPMSYMAAASRALFKIGPAQGDHNHYDLMIATEGNDIALYIEQIRSVFNKIEG